MYKFVLMRGLTKRVLILVWEATVSNPFFEHETSSNPVCSHHRNTKKKNTSLRHSATLGVAALVGPEHDVVRCGISKSRWIAELRTHLAVITWGPVSVKNPRLAHSLS